jgi:DNA-binding NarL/FixJ family response regulator
MNNHMTRLEKIALTSAVSGAVFNVFLYGIGATLKDAPQGYTPLFVARLVAAIVQAAAFDLVAIATVMGKQSGRWSKWSTLTAVAAAFVSAAIALDVAGVVSLPFLHAANALIVLSFTLHLLTPKKANRASQLRRLVRRLCAALRHERATSDHLASQLRQALERVRQLEEMPTTARTIEVISVAQRELSLRQLARVLELPESTVRRKVAQIEEAA